MSANSNYSIFHNLHLKYFIYIFSASVLWGMRQNSVYVIKCETLTMDTKEIGMHIMHWEQVCFETLNSTLITYKSQLPLFHELNFIKNKFMSIKQHCRYLIFFTKLYYLLGINILPTVSDFIAVSIVT